MLDIIKKNKIILVVVALLLAGFVWYGMGGGEETPDLLESDSLDGKVGSEVTVQERATLDTLFQLRSIQLLGNIFNDPAFQALRDYRIEIVSEPIGRKNPFAPLTATSSPAEEDN